MFGYIGACVYIFNEISLASSLLSSHLPLGGWQMAGACLQKLLPALFHSYMVSIYSLKGSVPRNRIVRTAQPSKIHNVRAVFENRWKGVKDGQNSVRSCSGVSKSTLLRASLVVELLTYQSQG